MSSKTYTTVQGDMWDAISKKIYGSERYAEQLMQANTAYISTVVFSAGIALTLPDVDTTSSTRSSSLPPWRT